MQGAGATPSGKMVLGNLQTIETFLEMMENHGQYMKICKLMMENSGNIMERIANKCIFRRGPAAAISMQHSRWSFRVRGAQRPCKAGKAGVGEHDENMGSEPGKWRRREFIGKIWKSWSFKGIVRWFLRCFHCYFSLCGLGFSWIFWVK